METVAPIKAQRFQAVRPPGRRRCCEAEVGRGAYLREPNIASQSLGLGWEWLSRRRSSLRGEGWDVQGGVGVGDGDRVVVVESRDSEEDLNGVEIERAGDVCLGLERVGRRVIQ